MPRLGLSLGSKGRVGSNPSVQLYRDTLRTWGDPDASFVNRQWFCSGSSSLVTYGSNAGGEGISITTGASGRHTLVHFDCQKNGSLLTNGPATYSQFDMGTMYGGAGQIVYGGVYGHGLYRSTGYMASGYSPVFTSSTSTQDANGWTRYRPVDTSIRKIIIAGSSIAAANGVYYRISGGTASFTKVSSGTTASIYTVNGDGTYLFVDGVGNVAKNTTENIDTNSWIPWTGGATGITATNKYDLYNTIFNNKSLRVSFTLECFGGVPLISDLNGLRAGLFASDGFYINTDNHSNSNAAFLNYTGYMASYGTRHRVYKRKTETSNLIWTTTAYDLRNDIPMSITTANPAFRVSLTASNSNNFTTFNSEIKSLGGNGSISGDTSSCSFSELTACSMCFDTLVVAATAGEMDRFKVSDVLAEII